MERLPCSFSTQQAVFSCYSPQFIIMARSIVALLALILLISLAKPANAFIDADGLSESLNAIEQDLSGDSSGLSGLLEDLDAAAGENADQYLQVTIGGKTRTMWDVSKNAWFFPHVLALTELGIVSGYKDASGNLTGSYGPGNSVTHAEALKITLGAAGVNPASCSGMLAHPKAQNHWAKQYVVCAMERDFGLTSATDLNAPASRAEVLHYVLKAFGVDAPNGTPPFKDSASHRYKDDIAYAYALEIVSGDKNADGTSKNTFRPNDSVNRAEVAKIVKLAIESL
jgi:hypothetical protein